MSRVFKRHQINLGDPFKIEYVKQNDLQELKHEDLPEYTREEIKEDEIQNAIEVAENIINEANNKAELIINNANLKAAKIIEDSNVEVDQIKIKAQNQYKEKGYEDGIKIAKEEYQDLLKEVVNIKENHRNEYKKLLQDTEPKIIDLIIEISKKVISDEFNINKENILYLVKKALEKISNKENVLLNVSVEDYNFLDENRDRVVSLVPNIGSLEIKKDKSLDKGSCIIETQYGSIDASIDTKLKKIEEVFHSLGRDRDEF